VWYGRRHKLLSNYGDLIAERMVAMVRGGSPRLKRVK